jgi:hypothetical protein
LDAFSYFKPKKIIIMKKRFILACLFVFLANIALEAQQVSSISVKNVTSGQLNLKKKNVLGLNLEILPTNAADKTIRYSSDNDAVAVSDQGEITGISAGSATVTISAQDGSGVTATVLVTVTDRTPELSANHPDGPYINYTSTDVKVISRDSEGYVIEKIYAQLHDNYTFTVLSDANEPGKTTRSSFEVTIHPLSRPNWRTPAPDSLLVISDPHAKWAPFISILKAQHIIDDHLNWSFGANQLMIIGDIFDRGDDAVTIFWLVYKLQQEARDAGGEVHFCYGNHEEMILRNSNGYLEAKYTDFSKNYLGTLLANYYGSRFFNKDTELGRWLGECNTIQIIGTDLFVHAGLNQAFYDKNYNLETVNTIMSTDILKTTGRDSYLFGSSSTTGGPLWYRGMIPGNSAYVTNALSKTTLDAMLVRYQVNRIILGHTEHNTGDGTIAYPEYDYKVVNVNVQTQTAMDANRGRGLLIVKGKESFIVFDRLANKSVNMPGATVPYPTAITEKSAAKKSEVWVNDRILYVQGQAIDKVRVYNLFGQIAQSVQGANALPLSGAGVYIVWILYVDQSQETVKVVAR